MRKVTNVQLEIADNSYMIDSYKHEDNNLAVCGASDKGETPDSETPERANLTTREHSFL